MFPRGISRPAVSPINDGTSFMHTDGSHTQAPTDIIEAIDGEASGEPTLTAFLVDDDTGVVATATLLDVEAGEKSISTVDQGQVWDHLSWQVLLLQQWLCQ